MLKIISGSNEAKLIPAKPVAVARAWDDLRLAVKS